MGTYLLLLPLPPCKLPGRRDDVADLAPVHLVMRQLLDVVPEIQKFDAPDLRLLVRRQTGVVDRELNARLERLRPSLRGRPFWLEDKIQQ